VKEGRYKIASIVEGPGEAEAVPKLLARWFVENGLYDFDPLPSIRANGRDKIKGKYDLKRRMGIEYYVDIAMSEEPDAMLVILDADDKEKGSRGKQGKPDCPKVLGPNLLARAQAVCPHIPLGVVLAYKEYEAWFLYILPELQRAGMIPKGIKLPTYKSDKEIPRGCKERLSSFMTEPYEPTRHQAIFTRYLPFNDKMKSRSRSYRHLLDTLDRLALDARNREI